MPFDVSPSPWNRDQPDAEPAGEPPSEALRAMRVAARVARELHESGRELRFTLGPSAVRVEVLLCDTDGMVLSRMTPVEALEIAAGSLSSEASDGGQHARPGADVVVRSDAVAGWGHADATGPISAAGA
jgi:hypothetical protein